jgi:hypothetical protein
MRSAPLPLLLWLAACGSGDPCGTDLSSGTGEATIDGAVVSLSGVTWLLAGSSLQINTEPAGGYNLSIVAQTTTSGLALDEALDQLPAEVSLTSDGGGWALVYPESGDAYSTDAAAGGTLSLTAREGDDLLGCLSFEAQAADGTVGIDGALRAAPSTL